MADRSEREFSSQAPAGYIGDFLSQGIFPYLQGFMQNQFDNIGTPDATPFTYTGDRIAEFDPREQYAMDMSDAAIGSYRPFISETSDIYRTGMDDFRNIQGAGLAAFGDAGAATAASRGDFDPSSMSSYYNPFEEQVVQQTLSDISRGLSQGDMALRDQAVSSGAFGGSRGRLTQEELARKTGRGAAEAVAGIRSGGFSDALKNAMTGFESGRQRDANAAGLFTGIGSDVGRTGMQGAGIAQSFGQGTANLGSQFAGLQEGDINRTMGIGSLGRGRSQAGLDRNYSDFVGTYNLPMTTLSNTGSILGALGPMAGGFGYAGSSAPQDFPRGTGQPFYPTQTMGAVGGGGMGGGMGGGGFFGGGIGSLPGGFYGMGGMPNYGSTATTGTYGMNMPVA